MRRPVAAALAAAALLIGTAAPASADLPPGGDNNPPNISIAIAPSPWEGWYGEPVSVTISANDGAGVESLSYRLTGAQTGGEEAETGPFTVTIAEPGQTTIDIEARDVNGNVATRRYGVGIDLGDPELVLGGTLVDGAVLNRGDYRYLTFDCSDAGTGIKSCTATNDGEPFQRGGAVETRSTGDHTVVMTAVDRVGRTVQRTVRYRVRLRPLTVISPPRLEGSPTVARVGVPLTVGGAVFEPTPGYFIYHWYVDGVRIADGETFTPRLQDLGKTVSVSAFGSLAGPDYDQTETAQVGHLVVQPGPLRVTRQPAIDGAPTAVFVGEELRATPAEFLPAAAQVTYRWYADGTQVGTGTTYTTKPADAGRRISLTASGIRADYAETSTPPVGSVPVRNNQFQLDASPEVSGEPRVGQEVRIAGARVTPTAMVVRNLWRIGDQTVETDSPALVLAPEHARLRLSCVQVFSSPGFEELSTPCLFAGGATEITVLPATGTGPSPGPRWRLLSRAAITGKAKAGATLRVVRPRVSAAATGWRYQWLRNGKVIRGATKAKYRVRARDRRDRIAVRVIATAPRLPALVSVSKTKRIRR